ncbi:hypothetical protein F4814DRAFT_287338 [Daldinia grandis]|nr:hypothetical protein F4814DRAFT_287338 [Daldinia grandis]
MLLRMPLDVFRRCVQTCTPNGRVTNLAFRRLMLPYMQAASIVSVSGIETGANLRTSIHVLFNNSRTSTQKLSESPEKPATGQKPEYFSVLFSEDDELADVAWTFAIDNGEDLLDALQRYAMAMRHDTSDEDYAEYTYAFQRFVTGLVVQSLLLDKGRKNARCDKDVDIPLEHPTRKLKTIGSTKRLTGKARDEEVELSFQQGQSPVDLATTLDRTPEFILREAKRLLGEEKLKQQMKWHKKGQWSESETQWLISQRNQGLPLNKIAKLLRRTEPNVNKKLRQLGTTILVSTVMEDGPQEVPTWLQQTLFSMRLLKIWKGLLESDMTPTWTEALLEKSAEHWLTTVSAGIPEDVKKILGGLQPPTYNKLEHLSPVISTDAGVYARLVTSRYSVQAASDRYLYIGSASKHGSGLQGRVGQHVRKEKKTRLDGDIKEMYLKAPGCFVTLMSMKMNSAEENVLDVRRTVILAEAILTIWLGALQSPGFQLQNLCPWDPDALDYRPWSSHNPLEVDFTLPNNAIIGRQV